MTQTSPDLSSTRRVPVLQLPLVSVVVTCYNHQDFVTACLDSVLAQTYPRIEVIVVDNLSTDGSRGVIEAFAESLARASKAVSFQTIFSPENTHEIGAVAQGFAKATGSYLLFIDGDDLLLPACVETHIKAHLVSRIAVGVTSVDMFESRGDEIVVGTGRLLSEFVMSRRGQARDFCRLGNLAALDFGPACRDDALAGGDLHYVAPSMSHEWVWSPSTGLCFRREAVELMFSPAPSIRVGADNYLVRGITSLTGGIVIDRALAMYRLHGNNLFSKHPALANFHTFDKARMAEFDVGVMGAIVECYRTHATQLAGRLDDADLYIDAVHRIARLSPALRARTRFSSFAMQFLRENRALLRGAFGSRTYARWMLRFMRPRDLIALLRRSARDPGMSRSK